MSLHKAWLRHGEDSCIHGTGAWVHPQRNGSVNRFGARLVHQLIVSLASVAQLSFNKLARETKINLQFI